MELLEQTLTFKLFNSKSRPSFVFFNNKIEIICLYDTGAVTPVWCMGERKFLKTYPEAIKQNNNCYISGFGQGREECFVYIIPKFELSNGYATYIINNLKLAVCNRPAIGYDIVLSETMFSMVDTVIRRRSGKLISFCFNKKEYNCISKDAMNTMSVSVFAM